MINISKIYDRFYSSRQKFLDNFLHLLSFSFIRTYLIFITIQCILLFLLAYFVKSHVSQNLIILHYNVDFGVDLIGDVGRIYIIPLLGFVISLINLLLLVNFIRTKQFKFVANVFFSASLLVNFFLLTALASIYLINFR